MTCVNFRLVVHDQDSLGHVVMLAQHPATVADECEAVVNAHGEPWNVTSQDLRVAFMPDSSSVPTLVGMRTTATFLAQPLVAASVPGGRIGPTIAALVGLAAVVLGWRTFRRHDRISGQPTAVIGIGAATVLAGVVFLALADEGPGSGNGVVGSGAAVTLGLVGIVLGVLARRRRERAA
jgi:Family of unknown function (DUF6223)